MRVPSLTRSLFWVVAVGVTLALPGAVRGAGEEPLRISPGQSFFIHAETIDGAADYVLEQRLENRFLKQKTFEITDRVEEADFVFFVYADYRVKRVVDAGGKTKSWTGYKKKEYLVFAEGFVVAREEYLEGLSSREDFRRKALWQFLAGSESFLSTPERRSLKLVKTFHAEYADLVISTPKTSTPAVAFAFEPGQQVYVAAYQLTGPSDVALERTLGTKFNQLGTFRSTNKLSRADFVFLVYSQYKTWGFPDIGPWATGPQQQVLTFAEVFAVTPAQFEEHELDLPMLRRVAHWQTIIGTGRTGIIPARHHKGLVRQFHEEVASVMAAK